MFILNFTSDYRGKVVSEEVMCGRHKDLSDLISL